MALNNLDLMKRGEVNELGVELMGVEGYHKWLYTPISVSDRPLTTPKQLLGTSKGIDEVEQLLYEWQDADEIYTDDFYNFDDEEYN